MCLDPITIAKKIKTILEQALFCLLIKGLANEEFNEVCNMPKPLEEM